MIKCINVNMNEYNIDITDLYDEICDDEQFVYSSLYRNSIIEFMAVRINNHYCTFINGNNKFIIAKRFKDCLSIGSGKIIEFDSYEQVKEYVLKNKPQIY